MNHEDDLHYRRFREEHAKALDAEYDEWKAERDRQRAAAKDAPAPEGALKSLGRAIGSVVTAPADPDGDEGLVRKPDPSSQH